jgi:hypothetical protein
LRRYWQVYTPPHIYISRNNGRSLIAAFKAEGTGFRDIRKFFKDWKVIFTKELFNADVTERSFKTGE